MPTNQLDRGWMATNTLSIIDLKAKKWLTSVILDTPQKGAANPWSVIVTPDDKQIIVAAAGSQELVRIDRIALHERLAKAKQGEMVTPSMKAWGNIPNDADSYMVSVTSFLHREKVRVRWLPQEVKFIQPIIIHRNWCLWI